MHMLKKEKILMTKHCLYATINSKHYISVSGTTWHFFYRCTPLWRGQTTSHYSTKDMEVFDAL